MRAILIVLLISLAGCDVYRDSPEQQAEDYKTCVAAGMRAFLTGLGEIMCAPKQEVAGHEQ